MYRTFCQTLCALLAFTLVLSLGIAPARAGILDGIGAIGATSSSSAPTSYPGLLQDNRGLNFGGVGVPYAYGQLGADSASVLAPGNQIDQLVTQVGLGNITLANFFVGNNDYIDVATDIATGALSGAALAAYQAQVATNLDTGVNAVQTAGAGVVLGGIINIVHSPAAAAIKANPVARALLENALSDGNDLIADVALAQGVPFIDFFALQSAVYDAGSAQIGGVDLILDGFDSDPHYFFESEFRVIGNLFIQAINDGYGTSIPVLSDLELLTLAGLENEYVDETFADTFAYPAYVTIPEPSGLVLAAVGLAARAAR